MKQVDFYLLANQVKQAKFKLASRLAKKLQGLNNRVLIIADNADDLACLDDTLWTFSGTSFVAHDRLSPDSTSLSKTHIGTPEQINERVLSNDYQVLISLTETVAPFSQRFTRIAEIVEADEPQKLAARARFKEYQRQGFELKTHNLEL